MWRVRAGYQVYRMSRCVAPVESSSQKCHDFATTTGHMFFYTFKAFYFVSFYCLFVSCTCVLGWRSLFPVAPLEHQGYSRGWGRCTHVIHGRRPSHPHNAGTEHVGFSPTGQALLAPRATRNVRCCESRIKGGLHPTKHRP